VKGDIPFLLVSDPDVLGDEIERTSAALQDLIDLEPGFHIVNNPL
jgi:hypothetical protein